MEYPYKVNSFFLNSLYSSFKKYHNYNYNNIFLCKPHRIKKRNTVRNNSLYYRNINFKFNNNLILFTSFNWYNDAELLLHFEYIINFKEFIKSGIKKNIWNIETFIKNIIYK
jgi:hypothetical protein